MKRFLPLLVLLSGCAEMELARRAANPEPSPIVADCSVFPTDYHAVEYFDGYLDWQAVPGVHHLEIVANKLTTPTLARNHFHRRAGDLCRADGYALYSASPTTIINSSGVPMAPSDFGVPAGGRVASANQTGVTVIGDVTCTGSRVTPAALPPDPKTICQKFRERVAAENAKRKAEYEESVRSRPASSGSDIQDERTKSMREQQQ